MDLSNKVAIVTGGASGIGQAITLCLVSYGAKVVINYHQSESKAMELVDLITKQGGQAIAVKADVSKFADAEYLMAETIKAFGKLNILVNNAGITEDALIVRMQEDQFDRVINTNLKGVWNMTKVASRVLLKSDYGRIINISSVSGVLGNIGQTNYSAAKAGVIGLTKATAREFATKGITVNAVAPGFIASHMTDRLSDEVKSAWLNMIPLKRFGKASEVAEVVAFLASNHGGYITGHTLEIDGGLVM